MHRSAVQAAACHGAQQLRLWRAIDHGHGVGSNFLHLSKLDVRVGQRVEQGDIIGRVGATGRATGPHLHWGLTWFEVRLDPQLLDLPPR